MTLDFAVVGAGPAGLAAATLGAELGLAVALFDEQATPGGQIFRASETTPARGVLGTDYARGAHLIETFRASGARYVPRASVWSVDAEGAVDAVIDRKAERAEARRILIATGALERPMPIPGWTLPGVMTAGAAQIALKAAGLRPQGRVVLAGTGPLLWLLARQLLAAGAPIEALLDTTPDANWPEAMTELPAFLTSSLFFRGLALQVEVRRRVRVVGGVEAIEALGEGSLRRVLFRRALQGEEEIEADLLLLHQGVVPNVHLAMAAGVAHEWDDRRLAFAPRLDPWGASSVERIAVAGDGGGIGGARAAEEGGRLAALDAAFRLGRIDAAERDRRAQPIRKELARAMRGRAFIDILHRPALGFRVPRGRTVVCRCEEIGAETIAGAIALGAPGPNQLKAFVRAGMGPCQGRQCALTVTETMAAALGKSPGEIGHMRVRPPVKPLSLGALAALPIDEASRRAVER
jgi:NADPH-dependent 2,4-dienoyl-CoA reductase/sulfur reductase-like enzyme